MNSYIAYVDGGCPNNGRSADHMFGSYVVYEITNLTEPVDHETLAEQRPVIENLRFDLALEGNTMRKITNNAAEAMSVLNLLTALTTRGLAKPGNHITVYCDSELTINQLIGAYRIKQPHLRGIHKHITNLFSRYQEKHGESLWDCVCFEWIPGDVMKTTRVGH